MSRLHTIWVDAGFDGNPFMHWVMDFCRWIIQVVIRPKESKKFVLLPKRWVVERTLGWRALVPEVKLHTTSYYHQTAETFVYIAMIRIMVRRLA